MWLQWLMFFTNYWSSAKLHRLMAQFFVRLLLSLRTPATSAGSQAILTSEPLATMEDFCSRSSQVWLLAGMTHRTPGSAILKTALLLEGKDTNHNQLKGQMLRVTSGRSPSTRRIPVVSLWSSRHRYLHQLQRCVATLKSMANQGSSPELLCCPQF